MTKHVVEVSLEPSPEWVVPLHTHTHTHTHTLTVSGVTLSLLDPRRVGGPRLLRGRTREWILTNDTGVAGFNVITSGKAGPGY